MKQRRGQQKLASLIPSVSAAEQRLDELMAEARRQAERTVDDARSRARETIRKAQAEIPAILSTEREAQMRRLRQEAELAAHQEQERTQALQRDARGALAAAVSFVVGRVWPGGSS